MSEVARKGNVALKRLNHHFDDMVLAVLVWMCTLPLVGLLVFPFFGLKISLIVASALLIAVLVLCWGICSWKIFKA
jgi:hypothetical protein